MADLTDALRRREVSFVVHDHLPDERLVAGNSDVAIRPSPRSRYEALREMLPEPSESSCFTSPVRRCQQTCARIRPDVTWEENDGLIGRTMGGWQGKTWDDVRVDDPVRCEAFWSEYATAKAPGGESLTDLAERADAYLLTLANTPGWRRAIVVTHPEFVRCIVAVVLGVELNTALRISVDPLSVTTFSNTWMGWQLDGLNHIP